MSTLKKTGLADLSERRYRIVLEESWYHERPEVRSADRIWYEQIPCRGEDCFIGVYSLEPLNLQLSTSRPKNARAVWEAIKGTLAQRPTSILTVRRLFTSSRTRFTLWLRLPGPEKKDTYLQRQKPGS
jgi:hypothetical protein